MKEKNQSIHPTLHAHDQKPHCLHCISAVFSSFPEQNSTRTMRTAMNIELLGI